MADVFYRSWALIYRDAEPEQQDPTVVQPPMLTTIAVDAGGSLVFALNSPPPRLSIQLRATGASSEGRGAAFLHVYRGAPGAYLPQSCTWSRSQDGAEALFRTTVEGTGDTLKLHLADGGTCIVIAVTIASDVD